MATIHRRKMRSGEVVWELTHGTGSDRQRFIAGRTREEAQTVLTQFNRQLALHGSAPDNAPIASVINEYAEYLRVNRRPKTTVRYVRILRTFNVCFLQVFQLQVQRIRDVRPTHVEEYKRRRAEGEITEGKSKEEVDREARLRIDLATTHRRARPVDNAKFGWLGRHKIRRHVSQRTVNYELRVLFTFFRWAIARNFLFINPCAQVERFRISKRALPKFMTSEDLKRFFAACTAEQRRLYMTILLSGMRKGEAEFLTWEDISLELGVIFIREKPDIGWRPKTDERLIPISPVLHGILIEQSVHRTSDQWVFANRSGNRTTHMLETLKKICRRAGIKPATVHALRHSFGAHLRMAGVNLADIADLLGHKDLATTQIYAKVLQDHLRQVVSKLTPLVIDAKPSESDQMSLENVTRAEIQNQASRKLLK